MFNISNLLEICRRKSGPISPLELLVPVDGCPYGFDNGLYRLQYGGKPEFCRHGNLPRHLIQEKPQNVDDLSRHPFNFSVKYVKDMDFYISK